MIFWYRPPPCKLLRALSELNVSCFTKYLKISDRICRFFCTSIVHCTSIVQLYCCTAGFGTRLVTGVTFEPRQLETIQKQF